MNHSWEIKCDLSESIVYFLAQRHLAEKITMLLVVGFSFFIVWSLKLHSQDSGRKKCHPVFCTLPVCSGNCISIRALESILLKNIKVGPQKSDFDGELQTRKFLFIVAIQPKVSFPR
jgi:hypothetical protein